MDINRKEIENVNEYVARIRKESIAKKDYGWPDYLAKPYSKWTDDDKAEYEKRWLEKVKVKNEINELVEKVLNDDNFFDDMLKNNVEKN